MLLAKVALKLFILIIHGRLSRAPRSTKIIVGAALCGCPGRARSPAPTIRYVLIFVLMGLTVFLPENVQPEPSAQPIEVGVEQKLGERVPLDLIFLDENGKTVTLRELITRPTIVSLVYFRCGRLCNPLLNSLSLVLDRLDLQPGQDYSVLTISFDDKDTPSSAGLKKRSYLQSMDKPFPEEAWKFLTGDEENIGKFIKAVGFKFKKEGEEFIHPALLIVLSDSGKITRYLFGTIYQPFDLKMALTEAAEGKVGSRVSKALLYCYSYDLQGRRYVLNTLKVSGILIVLGLIMFFLYLLAGKRSANTSRHDIDG